MFDCEVADCAFANKFNFEFAEFLTPKFNEVFCIQVFCIQFYLGTTRLQLEHKGDAAHHYTNFANVIVSFGFVVIPVIGWLLDQKGYGITLGTINCIGVIVSVLQAIPSLRLQVRLTMRFFVACT